MDQFDAATRLEQWGRETRLAAHASRARGRGPEWVDGVPCCRECGEPIPAARLAALGEGCELCVECAA